MTVTGHPSLQSLTLTILRSNASLIIYRQIPTIVYLIYNPLGCNYTGVTTDIQGFHNRTYCGSGNSIKKSIEKYGKKNHYFFILEEFYHEYFAYKLEKELVPWSRVWHDPYCLNECEGGKKPPSNLGKTHSKETREKISIATSGENHHSFGKPLSEKHKQKLSVAKLGKNHNFFGKNHSKESKQKISETKRDKRFDHLIKMLDDKRKSPGKRKHQCLLCHKILSNKFASIDHLKRKHNYVSAAED